LYILSSQLNRDTNLASASIALSPILSLFSLSLALLI
jgi:predicted permease